MAIFKLYRGLEKNMPTVITDGLAYFCKDTGNYYIDFTLDGTLTRSKISAKYADKLRYVSDGAAVELDPSNIITDSNYIAKIGVAATNKTGLMSGTDKEKLDSIASGANKTIVDEEISATSVNPVQNKVIKAALDEKAGLEVATESAKGLMSSDDKKKLEGIATGAEVNQNAFSNVKVGDVTIVANAKTDIMTVTAGTNVTITPDAANKMITIAAKDTTYNAATSDEAGLMSAADKEKLDSIATGANKYELPTASAETLGGVKVGTNLSIDENGVLSAKDTTYNNATTGAAGLMSAADKEKLDGVAEGATKVFVDAELSDASVNAIQNKVVKAALDGKADEGHTHDYIPNAEKGVANGVATLDADGKVPSTQLPSYVDDVVEYATEANFPTTGETGKIYVDLATNITYRWGGTTYVEISKSLAIGTTETTAAAGNHGHDSATTESAGFMSAADKAKLDGISEGANAYTLPTASADVLGGVKVGENLSINAEGVLSAKDTTYEVATTTANGLMSNTDKAKLDGIAEGANKTIVDAALSSTSTNPVQNKVINEALAGKSDEGHTHDEYINQNAFSKVTVGNTTVEADVATDEIKVVAGANVTITADANNDTITIAATDTTYEVVTESNAGLMASADKTKLDGIATGAQVNVLESITSESLKVGAIANKNIQIDIEWIEF